MMMRERTVAGVAAPQLRFTALDHIVLWVSDLDRAKHFYIEKLGMSLLRERLGPDTGNADPRDPDFRSFVGFGTYRIGLFQRPDIDVPAVNRLSHFALMVDGESLEELRDRLHRIGVETHGREGAPDHPCLYATDPDGHRIQFLVAPER
jgi:catechol 2,3-dioxygenase-like lactoylglutathione lyase family enzyme